MAIVFTKSGLMSVQNTPTIKFTSSAKSGGSVKTSSPTILSRVGGFAKKLFFGQKAVMGRPLLSLTTPFAPAGVRALGAIKKLGSYIGVGKPQSAKQILVNILKFGGAYSAGTYAATGKLPEPSLRTLAGYAGAQANLPATIFGAAHGLASEGIIKLKSAEQKLPYAMTPEYMQQLANMYKPNFEIPNLQGFGNITPNITLPSTNVQMPSYAPSLSVGGGQSASDYLPLLLLLLGGAGLAGYAIKKKRKKKRYKKRRKH